MTLKKRDGYSPKDEGVYLNKYGLSLLKWTVARTSLPPTYRLTPSSFGVTLSFPVRLVSAS